LVCFCAIPSVSYILFTTSLFSWGPNVTFNDVDVDLSSLQISDTDTKEESLNDSGYCSAEPDGDTTNQVTWDFEQHEAPAFEEQEDNFSDNDEKIVAKEEGYFQDELGGICTFVEMNEKVTQLLALGPDASLEGLA
jgi:hypothetical protein